MWCWAIPPCVSHWSAPTSDPTAPYPAEATPSPSRALRQAGEGQVHPPGRPLAQPIRGHLPAPGRSPRRVRGAEVQCLTPRRRSRKRPRSVTPSSGRSRRRHSGSTRRPPRGCLTTWGAGTACWPARASSNGSAGDCSNWAFRKRAWKVSIRGESRSGQSLVMKKGPLPPPTCCWNGSSVATTWSRLPGFWRPDCGLQRRLPASGCRRRRANCWGGALARSLPPGSCSRTTTCSPRPRRLVPASPNSMSKSPSPARRLPRSRLNCGPTNCS